MLGYRLNYRRVKSLFGFNDRLSKDNYKLELRICLSIRLEVELIVAHGLSQMGSK